MRILLVHNRYRSGAPSGENRVVDEEHRALAKAGHEVARVERSNDEIGSLDIGHKALVPFGAVWSRRSAEDVARSLAAFRPDVVHIHNVFPLLSPSVLGACTRAEVPCVVTLHNFCQVCVNGTLYRTGGPCSDCVGRRIPLPAVQHGCYRGSRVATLAPALSAVVNRRAWRTIPSAYLFLSRAQRLALAPAELPAWRSFVKANMVADPFGVEGGGAGGDATARRGPLVVYAGRLIEAKGVRTLLSAWERYSSGRAAPSRSGGPGLRLAIAGAGPLDDDVRAWARERRDVDLLGVVSPARCMELFGRATAVVVPSEWQEPFGLVVAEAMAAGAVPVATDRGALPELIRDGVDGLLYPGGDAEALGALLARIEAAPHDLERMRAAARSTYERTFAPAAVVAQLERVYRFAIDHPSWLEPATRPAASRLDDAAPAPRPTVAGGARRGA